MKGWIAAIGAGLVIAAGLVFASSKHDPAIQQWWLDGKNRRRVRPQTTGIVVHTTGTGLARVADGVSPWGTAPGQLQRYDAAALAWYHRANPDAHPHLLVGQSGAVYELMPLALTAWHVALQDKYSGQWNRPGWWVERWPGHVSPAQIQGQFPNNQTVAVDLIPDPRGGYTDHQLDVAGRLIGMLARQNKLAVRRGTVMGHSDLDPIGRPGNRDPGLSASQWSTLLQTAESNV